MSHRNSKQPHYDAQIDELLITSINAIEQRIYAIAHAKGWWACSLCNGVREIEAKGRGDRAAGVIRCPLCDGTGSHRNDGEVIALMHSELSEMLEGFREGNPRSEKLGEGFSQAEEEGADLIIRLLDFACGRGWRIAEAMLAKIAVNDKRPHRHGGKEF